jgi:hypothetical protein
MRFHTLHSVLALSIVINAIALPSEQTSVLNGSISAAVELPVPKVKRASGAEGTLHYRWISARSFAASYNLKDTSCDSHPVYIETEVDDVNDLATFVLRCNNNNGCSGNEITCAERTYTHGSTIVAIAPYICINVQLGSDICSTGSAVLNPYR